MSDLLDDTAVLYTDDRAGPCRTAYVNLVGNESFFEQLQQSDEWSKRDMGVAGGQTPRQIPCWRSGSRGVRDAS